MLNTSAEYIEREAFKQKYLCCGYLPEMSEKEFDEFPTAAACENCTEVQIMYKPLADSTLHSMTKKEIIELLRIAEHNAKVSL